MADDDTLNTTTTTGGGIIFDTYTDWWVFLTITVVCWSVVYGVVSKSMRDAPSASGQLNMDKEKCVLRLVALVLFITLLTPDIRAPPANDTPITCTEETCRRPCGASNRR